MVTPVARVRQSAILPVIRAARQPDDGEHGRITTRLSFSWRRPREER